MGQLWFVLGDSAALCLSRMSLCHSGFQGFTGLELGIGYELKAGNRFIHVKDEVADIRYICLAILITSFGLF